MFRGWRKRDGEDQSRDDCGGRARRFAVAEGFEKMKSAYRALAKDLAAWKAASSMNWRPELIRRNEKEHVSAIFDGDEKQIAYAERVIAHPPTGTIPCMAVDARRGHFRDHDHVGVVVENSGARGGFANYLGRGAAWTMKWERRARPGRAKKI